MATMWSLIDRMDTYEKAQMQKFNIYRSVEHGQSILTIEHHQEYPEYFSPIVHIEHGPYWTGDVVAFDDGQKTVMCLPEEVEAAQEATDLPHAPAFLTAWKENQHKEMREPYGKG